MIKSVFMFVFVFLCVTLNKKKPSRTPLYLVLEPSLAVQDYLYLFRISFFPFPSPYASLLRSCSTKPKPSHAVHYYLNLFRISFFLFPSPWVRSLNAYLSSSSQFYFLPFPYFATVSS